MTRSTRVKFSFRREVDRQTAKWSHLPLVFDAIYEGLRSYHKSVLNNFMYRYSKLSRQQYRQTLIEPMTTPATHAFRTCLRRRRRWSLSLRQLGVSRVKCVRPQRCWQRTWLGRPNITRVFRCSWSALNARSSYCRILCKAMQGRQANDRSVESKHLTLLLA